MWRYLISECRATTWSIMAVSKSNVELWVGHITWNNKLIVTGPPSQCGGQFLCVMLTQCFNIVTLFTDRWESGQLSQYSNELQLGFDSQHGQDFSLLPASILALGSTQPPIQCVLGVIFPEVKWMRCEADHLPPSSVKVKNGGVIPPLPHMSSWHSN
jgi:hypothetical protein